MGFSNDILSLFVFVFFCVRVCVKRQTAPALRDSTQDLDAFLMSKPQDPTIEMVGMWQDHIGRTLAKQPATLGSAGETTVEVEEAEDTRENIFRSIFSHCR